MIHAIITTKDQKYPSTTILKHTNILAKVNERIHNNMWNKSSILLD